MSVTDSLRESSSSGIPGLDQILSGGFPSGHIYIVEGEPGAGKTTLGLQFLLAGRDAGETGVYVALSETATEIESVARSHGWDLSGIEVYEVSRTADALDEQDSFSLFHPAEVELGHMMRRLLDHLEAVNPKRVVIDSLTEMRAIARDPLPFRRQIVALRNHFADQRATVLLLDPGGSDPDLQSRTIAHGIISLVHRTPEFGPDRRLLRIPKMRAVEHDGAFHDYRLTQDGIVVYPRLIARQHRHPIAREQVSSGIAQLDTMLGGGLDRGTSTLLLGPAGVGKSTIALQYVLAAAARGERGAIFTFDEGLHTVAQRADSLGMPLQRYIEEGLVSLRRVDPGELTPGQFAHMVRTGVEQSGVRVVVIDSLNAFLAAMAEERLVVIQLHELLTYLAQQGVVTLMVVAQGGLLGSNMDSPVEVSYISDTVILLRYFEHCGRVRKALSVLKKRTGAHEATVRELRIDGSGLELSAPLQQFQAVLTGRPVYVGKADDLLEQSP